MAPATTTAPAQLHPIIAEDGEAGNTTDLDSGDEDDEDEGVQMLEAHHLADPGISFIFYFILLIIYKSMLRKYCWRCYSLHSC
jgi:hypothetical protein